MSRVHVDERQDGIYVRASTYLLWLPREKPYALLTDIEGVPWAEPFLASSLHTTDGLDDTLRLHEPQVRRAESGVRLVIDSDSTRWRSKRTVLTCEPTQVHAEVTVEGQGTLTDVHLLGGYYSGDRGHGSGFHHSGADFRSVCNPEPWGSERRVLTAGEATLLDVLGSSVPGKEHWLFTPPPLCLPVNREAPPGEDNAFPPGPWLAIGVSAAPGDHNFTALHYDAVEGAFSLRLSYEAQTHVTDSFTTPTVTFLPEQDDPYTALAAHVESVRDAGWLPERPAADPPAWWSEPIFCGWGSQCVLAGLEGGEPQDHATADSYDRFLAALEERGLRPGTVVLDDKWQQDYGSWPADERKWPDLRGWIARRHDAGQRVLLWWKAWDPEGLADELCVLNDRGIPMGVDPTHPTYEAELRASVRRMLHPDGYDADGFKIDFSARTPSGPGLRRHGDVWGIELLHRLLWIIHDEAKRTKPDALVVTHTPHPYFADVTDMIRLNDVNTRAPVVPQMRHRAAVARAACPDLLIDTDNWPIPNRDEFLDYVRAQPSLGVPALYYATHLDDLPPWSKGRGHVNWQGFRAARAADGAAVHETSGQPIEMTPDDYRTIHDAWERARHADINP